MKSISEPFIKRPVTTSLLMIAISLAGLLSYRLLPVSALPSVDFPTIQVVSRYPGADAQVMASLVTAPLERQLGQISGVASMRSASAMGITMITLQFVLGKDMDQSAQDVQTAISVASSVLPKDLPYPPIYHKVNPADMPVLTIAITSDNLPLVRVNDYVDSILAQRLSEVSGVGLVTIQGNQKPAVRVQLNPSTLAAKGISLEEVRKMIIRANANSPKGSLEGVRQSLTIGANDQIRNASELAKVLLSHQGGVPVCLQDVATLEDGVENSLARAWIASYQQPYQQAVLLDIQRQPNANIIRTANRVKSILPQITRVLPAGMHLSVFSDRTETIRASMQDVQFTLLLTVSLVILVLVLFLRKLGTAFIPTVTLPISMLGTFVLLYFSGFSLDSLSLMALTISAGFVVDDAVVVTENVVRHMEQGESPLSAALKGTQQIGFTVISLSISLIAVFIPLLFMPGVIGRLLREFSITLSCAVAISALVSLTLTPMLWALQHKRFVQGLLLITLVGTLFLYKIVPKGFFPQQDTGLMFGVTASSKNLSYPALQSKQQRLAEVILADPAVASVVSIIHRGDASPSSSYLYVSLKPLSERRVRVEKVIHRLRPKLAIVQGMALHLFPAQELRMGGRIGMAQHQYALRSDSSSTLLEWAPRLLKKLREHPKLVDVESSQELDSAQIKVSINHSLAGRLGIQSEQVSAALRSAFGQQKVSTIYSSTNQSHVILGTGPEFSGNPDSLNKIHIKSSSGDLVPLSTIASFKRERSLLSVNHEDQFAAVILAFNLKEGVSLGEAIEAVEKAYGELHMPLSIRGEFVGNAKLLRKASSSQLLLILAAVVAVYIVLGILYESLLHPLTILSTLPTAGIGALLALLLVGIELSIMAMIGIILLVGIVKRNAIIMVDFAVESQRRRGLSAYEAIHQAAIKRFRPILMTNITALLGALPLAIGRGSGAELRQPLGVAIVGGILASQILTLFTTPVTYLTLEYLKGVFSEPGVPLLQRCGKLLTKTARLANSPKG
ncbi:MAG: efflux RND transporter permease subunit [Candidatus Xiphinematobacter sp.]|nr:MAG: efflux RND transporter permease subunit [Candidatus Xiphinematobacter sp.]